MKNRISTIALFLAGALALCPLASLALEGSPSVAPIDSVHKVEGKKDLFRSTKGKRIRYPTQLEGLLGAKIPLTILK